VWGGSSGCGDRGAAACARRAAHVVEHVLPVESILLGNLDQPLWSEGALRVDVHGLAFSAALLERQLGRHAQRVAKLRLARTKLAEDLGDGTGLDASAQQLVEVLGPGREVDDLLPLLVYLGGGGEAHVDHLVRRR
jgi:hypothetical protein